MSDTIASAQYAGGKPVLGIDIGGSGIKGAPVDPATGELMEERYKVETPRPADVDHIVKAVGHVADRFGVTDHVGVAFPGVVASGVVRSAANVDKSWLDADASDLFGAAIGRPTTVLNDADAAGMAEMTFGAGRGRSGVTIVLTLGTGIGSAVFLNGVLVPNTELGHLELHGDDAERGASARARDAERLDWPTWAGRLRAYLAHLENLLWPDLLIIGGGISRDADKFLPLINIRTPIVPAMLRNTAGIVGAAAAATSAAAAARTTAAGTEAARQPL